MLPQTPVYALQETGMDSHVFHALRVKPGTQPAYHAHAQPILSGMV